MQVWLILCNVETYGYVKEFWNCQSSPLWVGGAPASQPHTPPELCFCIKAACSEAAFCRWSSSTSFCNVSMVWSFCRSSATSTCLEEYIQYGRFQQFNLMGLSLSDPRWYKTRLWLYHDAESGRVLAWFMISIPCLCDTKTWKILINKGATNMDSLNWCASCEPHVADGFFRNDKW